MPNYRFILDVDVAVADEAALRRACLDLPDSVDGLTEQETTVEAASIEQVVTEVLYAALSPLDVVVPGLEPRGDRCGTEQVSLL